MESPQAYEVLTFCVLVVIFETLERLRPAREIDRWKHLKIDVLSFALAILMNQSSSFLVNRFVQVYAPVWLALGWLALRGLPGALRILLAILTADLMIYWIHRAQHRFDSLWRTHAWHHTVEQLYWFSGFRVSFLHSLLYSIPQVVIPMLVFHLSPLEAGIAYSLGVLIQFWEHTNTDFDIGWLRFLIITPAYHRVHHSVEHISTNYGTTFSLWDRMFGTYCAPARVPANARLGLGKPLETKRIARMLAGV